MRSFTSLIALLAAAQACAGVTMHLQKADPNLFYPPLVNPPEDLIVWELVATVPPGETLLECECEFGVSGAWFLNETTGSTTAPDPAQFLLMPNLQMDTFVTSPTAYPNASGNANVTLLPRSSFGGQQFASKITRVAWSFNEPVGPGTWVVARFGVSLNAPIVYYKGCMEGATTSAAAGTVPFSLNIIKGGPCPWCIADITGDDWVCNDDLGLMLSAFGTCEGDPGYIEVANLDSTPTACGSQGINQGDLGILLSQYGCGCP